MAAGCPVIVTPEVGASDVVRRSGAGLVVAGEPAALAAAIGDLLASPERGAAMGRAGQKVALEEFAWSQMASRFTQLYESC
jgi:phosphatidylinositol alpha-1,6-mannosyltransferase